ncbi:MAG: hypothetical protein ACRC0Y_04090 [Fusobacteriaceae bacterium]
MIRMISNNGVSLEFDGKISRLPSKRGLSVVETNLGVEKSESIRPVVNLEISVLYISEEDYYKLESIFFTSTYVDIEDSSRGVYYSKYYISGDRIQLEEREDVVSNTYFYVGGIQLNKR